MTVIIPTQFLVDCIHCKEWNETKVRNLFEDLHFSLVDLLWHPSIAAADKLWALDYVLDDMPWAGTPTQEVSAFRRFLDEKGAGDAWSQAHSAWWSAMGVGHSVFSGGDILRSRWFDTFSREFCARRVEEIRDLLKEFEEEGELE